MQINSTALAKEAILMPRSDANHLFAEVASLIPSECHNEQRAVSLAKRIRNEGVWTRPILIERKTRVVMDGHHRLVASQALGLRVLPCLALDYTDPELSVTRWESNEPISPDEILAAARSGKLLPYKTTKHVYSGTWNCDPIALELLR